MKTRTLLGAVAGLTLALGAALPAIAGTTTPTNIITTTTPTTYTITDLAIPGIGVTGISSDPSHQWPPPPTINSSGAVAGSYGTSTSNGAFLWQNGTFTDLGTLGGFPSSFGSTINNNGQIVGWGPIPITAGNGIGADTPLLWQGGTYTVLGSLGGQDANGQPAGRAFAINAAGQVIGWSLAPNGRPHAFLWQNGTMTD